MNTPGLCSPAAKYPISVLILVFGILQRYQSQRGRGLQGFSPTFAPSKGFLSSPVLCLPSLESTISFVFAAVLYVNGLNLLLWQGLSLIRASPQSLPLPTPDSTLEESQAGSRSTNLIAWIVVCMAALEN